MTGLSVVMPAYNEEDGVGGVVRAFLDMDAVDEVIVADNNSTDQTRTVAEAAGAHVVQEGQQGYGYAMNRALTEASGDIIVSVESDQSYVAEDLHKLLAYADDADIVAGDRTNTALIAEGAKMGAFLRFGNKFLGRIIQILFDGPRITDVGCSFRLYHRDALDTLLSKGVQGVHLYSPQLLIDALKEGMDIVVVPVWYRERVGESKGTKSIPHATIIGVQMLWYILSEGIRCRTTKS